MIAYPRGSEWRKWDLHFHTPSSYDYSNKSVKNNNIIEILKQNYISVVAITDHHNIDVVRINELKVIAKEEVTILPGIELRSELGGSESIHFIGIFPEDAPIEAIWTKLQGRFNLTSDDIDKNGDDNVYTSLKEASILIHELGGIVTIHAGKKSNSIENITNSLPYKMTQKKDILDSIDIFEMGQVKDIKEYKDKVYPNIDKKPPMIICSDNHDIINYKLKECCWIKANPTFKGLKQILNEPNERVFFGEIPPKIVRIQNNKTKYISSIRIERKRDTTLSEIWFDNTISLNQELVAIIGNKGKGKSSLTDTIGLLCNTKQYRDFTFLSTDNFRQPKDNKSKHFQATLKWESGVEITKGLDEIVDEQQPELVKYIPQNFLEKICTQLGKIEESDFDRELKKVIFSHVDSANRLGKASLDELIAYKTSEANAKIQILKQELHHINENIVTLEEKTQSEYRLRLDNLLIQKRSELEAHEKSIPVEVPKPENDPQKQQEIFMVSTEIETARKEFAEYELQIIKMNQEQAVNIYLILIADKLIARLENLERQLRTFVTDSQGDTEILKLSIDSILKVSIDKKPLFDKRDLVLKQKTKITEQADPLIPDSLAQKKINIEKRIKQLQAKLDEPNKKYQEYMVALKVWEQQSKTIIGDETSIGSVKYYEKQLQALKVIPERLGEVRISRLNKAKEIHAVIMQLAKAYEELYASVHQFIEMRPLAKEKFNLNFEVSITDSGFENNFFEIVSRGVTGTFSGVEEGSKMLRGILKRIDFNTEPDIEAFLSEIIDSLEKDKRHGSNPIKVTDQIRKGKDIIELYDLIFSLDYLKPRYALRMGEKELHQLSPGERGTLLLIFYLLVDKDDIPLVIDQPEENLDNQTIYELLAPCIKEAKQRRQVLIVTHNPNLAVVCDAEQVICADLDKKNNYRMNYLLGAIEDPIINKAIVDILEGTRPAFDKRDSKYQRDTK
jgi:ABC-type lipoprotein export system ATPase subunit